MISDGAAALIIADDELALEAERSISFKARVQMNDLMPMSKRDKTEFRGAALSWKKALSDAQINLMDLSFVETHDCFTIAELIEYEAMGLTQRGEGYKVLEEGTVYKDGKLPINPSGGLKAKGHPVGATGVSQHVMACMQLVGEAKDMQIKDASLGGIFNMGGSAVANYVSILEKKAKDLPQIIIIRHAKSDWSSFNSDFERGLNERGYRSCEIISRELKRRINLPDKFLVSPAKRAQLTFEEIFFSWIQNKSNFQSTYNEEILYGGSKFDILNLIKQNFSGIQTGVVIGHNPVLSELINDMAFKNKKYYHLI